MFLLSEISKENQNFESKSYIFFLYLMRKLKINNSLPLPLSILYIIFDIRRFGFWLPSSTFNSLMGIRFMYFEIEPFSESSHLEHHVCKESGS